MRVVCIPSNGSEADVGEDDLGVGSARPDISGLARVSSARAALGTRLVGLVDGVCAVEPEHVDAELSAMLMSSCLSSMSSEELLTSSQTLITRTMPLVRASDI